MRYKISTKLYQVQFWSENVSKRTRRSDGPSQARGHSTRQRILDSAEKLYLSKPTGEVSVAAIAADAGAFPNQVTYYFGSKDSLFIHAAFLALLHDAERVETVGLSVESPASFRSAMARTVLILPSLPLVVRALAVGTSRPDLSAVVDQHFKSPLPPVRAVLDPPAEATKLGARTPLARGDEDVLERSVWCDAPVASRRHRKWQ